jgi:DNA-binding CsgD family transcriptional regulator
MQAIDQLNTGIIITESGAKVLEINQPAQSIVQLEDGILIREDRLLARRAFESTKLAQLISGATAEPEPCAIAGRMLIGRCDSLPAYVLSVAPLGSGLAVNERRLALVVVVDPVRHAPSDTDLAEFFGLSRAEARLAAALLTGKTLAEIAAASGIRITTVRTQLTSTLRKVGAERQADLVRILSSTGMGLVSLLSAWFKMAGAVPQIRLWFTGA